MYLQMKVFWIASIHIYVCSAPYPPSFHIVNTQFGQIKGIEDIESSSIKTYMFLGVPYAEPPERFKKPKPLKPWSGVKSAVSSTDTKMCNQIIYSTNSESEVDEDCLYCDIYVPWNIDDKNRKAVVIWILGGRFLEGQRNFFPAKKFSLNGDVINVVVAYRVGVFGFLSTGDAVIPGNFGLWDQQMAIEWVKENIHLFGGDPTRITLAGFEAGAVSASLHAVSSQSAGNFQRILLYSAQLNTKDIIWHGAPQYAKRLTIYMCRDNLTDVLNFTSKHIYDCLVSKSAIELTYSFHAVLGQSVKKFGYPVGPVIDNDLIYPTINFKDFHSVDVLISLIQNEHFMLFNEQVTALEPIYQFNKNHKIPRDVLCKEFIPAIVGLFYNTTDQSSLIGLICDFYTDTDDIEQSRNALRLLGDYFHYYPIIHTLESYSSISNNASTYLCLFTQKSLFEVFTSDFQWLKGTIDGDDLAYLVSLNLNSLLDPSVATPETVKTVSILSKYWSDFIKTGNPNGDPSLPYWEKFEPENQYYIDLNASPTTKSFLFKDRIEFWRNTVPAFLQSKQTSIATSPNAESTETTKTTSAEVLATAQFTLKSTHVSNVSDKTSVKIPSSTASVPSSEEFGAVNISNVLKLSFILFLLYILLFAAFYKFI